MSPQIEIQLIAIIVAVAAALPGVFLVLRRMSMMSDSITHTILLGIVLAFFVTRDLNSPALMVGAAAMGVVTVWLTELVSSTKLVSEDSAIGIVFPLLFAIAIILITKYAGSVHLDTDSVLLGELAFAPFDRMVVFGRDIGARAIYTSGALLLINVVVICLFFKELKLVTFDPVLASVMGFTPALVHYGLMGLTSLTAVGAFEAVGSVLVVAFMIGPPATAYLLTDDLKAMLLLSAIFGALSGVLGYQAAAALDVSIAGCMAVATGAIFLTVFIVAPRRGLVAGLRRRRRQRRAFAGDTLLLHLYHEDGGRSPQELTIQLGWEKTRLQRALGDLEARDLIKTTGNRAALTRAGEAYSEDVEKRLFG